MKRLLKTTLDSTIFSFIPIISWFLLGLLIDKNLVNVFSLTYPIQFIYALINSIFGVAPNIGKEKHNDNNAVMSGIFLGIIVGFFIFGFIAINIDKYIIFMNMDVSIYHTFGFYSIISLYISSIFSLLQQKLYFENKYTKANIYTFTYNLINFFVLIISSIILKNQTYIIITTLLALLICIAIMLVKEYNNFKFNINVLSYIKYDSVDICNNLLFFIIFLFGLKNAASFGANYMAALNFVALITDTQWDAFNAISTVAKIDISKNDFNYIEHRNNAYKLLIILMASTLLMFITLFPLYELNILLVFIYLSLELINFIIYPIYRIKTCFLQLEYSIIKTTVNKFAASFGRILLTFLKTPFCTGIGQCVSSIYQFISINIIFKKHFKIEKTGYIKKLAS